MDKFAMTSVPSTDQTELSSQDALTTVLPDSNSISGPLIYLGVSVFRFYEYFHMSDVANPTVENMTINFSLKTVILFFYTL